MLGNWPELVIMTTIIITIKHSNCNIFAAILTRYSDSSMPPINKQNGNIIRRLYWGLKNILTSFKKATPFQLQAICLPPTLVFSHDSVFSPLYLHTAIPSSESAFKTHTQTHTHLFNRLSVLTPLVY